MSGRAVVLVFAGCFAATATWASVIACPRPEEDACSSAPSLLEYVGVIGAVLAIAVTLVLAVAIKLAHFVRRRRRL